MQRARGSLAWTATCSRSEKSERLSGDRLPVLEAIGHSAEGEHLGCSHGLIPGLAVCQDSRKVGDFCNPATISFTFKFDRKSHTL